MSNLSLTSPPTGNARERVHALLAKVEHDGLEAVEDVLERIVAHQNVDTRNLTTAELSALSRVGVQEDMLLRPSPLPAVTAGVFAEHALEYEAFTAAEIAHLLGVSAARVRQRAAEGSLISRRHRNGWRFPTFQFPKGAEMPGWSVVARAIPPGTHLVTIERTLSTPSSRLVVDGTETSVLTWLSSGGDVDTARQVVHDQLTRIA